MNAIRVRAAVKSLVDGQTKDSEVASVLRALPPLNRLRHPLILAFDDQFAGDDDGSLLRESISAVTDRKWWKQTYSSRWRGAATVLSAGAVETVWLGAAGYHRDDSPEDFYAWFGGACSSTSDAFLPQEEDAQLERIGEKIKNRDAWMLQLHLTTLVLLANALESGAAGPVEVLDSAGRDKVLELSISVDSVEEADGRLREVTVEIGAVTWDATRYADVGTRVILAAIEPEATQWTTAPLGPMSLSHASILSSESEERALAARATGALSAAEKPGAVRLGTVAHYAQIDGLTAASVLGEPVRAICGYWFVPMHDHAGKDLCSTCEAAHQELPR